MAYQKSRGGGTSDRFKPTPGDQCCCFVCLHEDQVGVATYLGKYQTNLHPGCQYVGADFCGMCVGSLVVSSRVGQNVTPCSTKTKDNVFVDIEVAVQQQPRPAQVYDCLYKIGDPGQQISSFVTDVVRSQVPEMTVDQVFSEKATIADAVQGMLKEKMMPYGWEIKSALVTNVSPELNVKRSMNSIEAAKRNQVAAEVTADARKNVAVRRAEADAEAKALQGEGISRQRQAIVQGLKDSVGLVDPDEVSELLLITQYFDTLEKISTCKGTTLFIPHSVGGVTEISKEISRGVLERSQGD